MKMFNIFKKHTEDFEKVNNNGMDKFEGEVININNDEIEEFTSMPNF